jgi:hypothetical protein
MGDGFVNEWAWSTRDSPRREVLTSSNLSTSGAGEKTNSTPIITGNDYITNIVPIALGVTPATELTTSGC